MANRLADVRRERGMSRNHLAKITGLSESGLRGLEQFKSRTPRGDVLLRLADALDVPPADLLDVEVAR